MVALELEAAGEDEYVVFGARTLGIARDLVWRRLVRINDRYMLGWRVQEARHEITTRRGAEFRLFGVDDSVSIEKVRGKKYRLVICDEASTYQEHIEKLIRDCFAPGTKDFDPPGRIVIAGTPGYVCAGFWHDISWLRPEDATTQHQRALASAFKRFAWTLDDNPHIPNVEAALREERETWGLTDDDPVYLREYRGQWISDGSSLVYAYDPTRNAVHDLPEPFDADTWLTTVAADIGYTDDFAVVVVGSPKHSRTTYVLHAFKQSGLLVGAQAELIHRARQQYRPTRTVIDAGGQGKLVLEEFNARYGAAAGGRALPAEKGSKVEAIGMLNSDLRSGALQVLMPDAEPVASEMMHLPWASAARDKEHPAFPNHVVDATLYGWRAHRGFMQPAAPKVLTESEEEQRRREERNRRERQRQEAERRNQRAAGGRRR